MCNLVLARGHAMLTHRDCIIDSYFQPKTIDFSESHWEYMALLRIELRTLCLHDTHCRPFIGLIVETEGIFNYYLLCSGMNPIPILRASVNCLSYYGPAYGPWYPVPWTL